jgi:Uma2 family endonuclease
MSTVLTEPAYHLELIDGREIQKPLPKELHAIIQSYLIAELRAQLPKQKFRALSELNVLCGEDRLVPDITVARRKSKYRDGDLADPPLLCIEIFSPGQTFATLFDRAERLLKPGTAACWLIWPERRQAWIYTAERLSEAGETLHASLGDGDSIQISVAEMWAELD